MLCRVLVGLRPHVRDVLGERVMRKIQHELQLDVKSVRIINVFTIDGLNQKQINLLLQNNTLSDPVLHETSLAPLPAEFDYILEVGFRPGVTDNEGRTAQESIALVLGLDEKAAAECKVYQNVCPIFLKFRDKID